MTDDRRFFFLHLQKTAGTALWQRLNDAFPPEQLYPSPADGTPPLTTLSVPHLLERWAVRRHEIRVVTGHFPLCTIERLGGTFTTFTLLRDPVERVLSGLRHHREYEPALADTPLEEIYDDPLRHRLLCNHMVKMLAMTAAEMTDGALSPIDVTPEREAVAAARLRTIDVVGVQPRFDAFCDALEARFGWDLGPSRFANRTTPVEVDPALREQIAADNAADARLYAVAEAIAC